MKNKKGFTLAEVLITLGIIGVVAALTAPGLILGSRNQANASKLAVLSANIENAFTTAIASEGVDDLTETEMWGKDSDSTDFAGELGKYLHILGANENIGYDIYQIDSTSVDASLPEDWIEGSIPILTKSGAIIYIRNVISNNSANENDIIAKGGSLIVQAGTVAIDVNGTGEPNQYGRDVFVYRIGSNGILYPQGGKDVSIFLNDGDDDSETTDYYQNSSNSDSMCSTDEGTGFGLGCTARVIEEGYKMSY